jgi:hypothetical protein
VELINAQLFLISVIGRLILPIPADRKALLPSSVCCQAIKKRATYIENNRDLYSLSLAASRDNTFNMSEVSMNVELQRAMAILMVCSIINVAASVLTLALIWFMLRNKTIRLNLYIKCVILMTVYQGMYDLAVWPIGMLSIMYNAITILLPTAISHQSSHSPLTSSPLSDPPDDPRICGVPSGKHMCTAVYTALFTIGGYGASIWAIMLIVAADFTAEMGRPPTRTEENISCVVVHALMLVQVYHICAAAYISSDAPHDFIDQVLIYDSTRVVLIFLSAAVVARMYYVLCKMAPKGQRHRSPLYHLLRKLVYYPLVQCLSRATVTPYDFGYRSTPASFPPNAGALQVCASGPVRRACVCAQCRAVSCPPDLGSNPAPLPPPPFQTILMYLEVIFMPTAGLGALFVFLYVQKGARSQLRRLCRLDFAPGPGAADAKGAHDSGSGKVAGGLAAQDALETEKRISSRRAAPLPLAVPGEGGNAVLTSPQQYEYAEGGKSGELSDARGSYDFTYAASYESNNSRGGGGSTEQQEWERMSLMDEEELVREYTMGISGSHNNVPSVMGAAAGSCPRTGAGAGVGTSPHPATPL